MGYVIYELSPACGHAFTINFLLMVLPKPN